MPAAPAVILTQEAQDNAKLAALFAAREIATIDYPCIATNLLPYRGGLLPGDRQLEDFNLLAFTSKRAVAGMAPMRERLMAVRPRIASVGEATAREVEFRLGLSCELIPTDQTGAGLAKLILEQLSPPRPLLHPRGNRSTGDLQRILRAHGWEVCELIVYENHSPQVEPLGELAGAIGLFASPSAAKCFFAANESLTSTLRCIVIGSVTKRALENLGVRDVIEADQPSLAGMVSTVCRVIDEENEHGTKN